MLIALSLIGGMIILTAGAELLVRNASKLAVGLGISPLVVGLTIVAFGTSAPELVVSLYATLDGQTDIALGNVVGSNILNILLILGISASIIPLTVMRRVIQVDVPLMVLLSFGVLLMAANGAISRFDGLLLLAFQLGYTWWSVREGRRATKEEQALWLEGVTVEDAKPTPLRMLLELALIGVGLGLLVLGSRLFSSAAVEIARSFGVSEFVIGLTVVAAGTSLPEVATSVVAALRGERDMAVGNIVGSNIMNLAFVLALCGIFATDGIAVSEAALWFDLPVMCAAAFACLPIFFSGHSIARWEGALFLFYYVAYTAYLIISQTMEPWIDHYRLALLGFAVPLTVVTLAVSSVNEFRAQRALRRK